MSNDIDMRERHGRVLAELAETGMVMVRRLSDAMLATDDVQTQAQIGLAYHRVSRAVRQTMALEFRLSQAARREVAPARSAPPPEPKPAALPRERPERSDWNEYERDDSDEALDALDELLEAEDIDLEAVHETVEASMERIRRDIAADPLLVKAGVLAPSALASRRSDLLGGAALTPSFPTQWERGTARRAAGEERVVERASPVPRAVQRLVDQPSLRLTLSTTPSAGRGPPLPLRGKGSP